MTPAREAQGAVTISRRGAPAPAAGLDLDFLSRFNERVLRGPLCRAGRAAASVALPVSAGVAAFVALRLAALNAFYRPADSWLLWAWLSAALLLAVLPLAFVAAMVPTLVGRNRGRLATALAARSSALGLLIALLVAFEARCASRGHWGVAIVLPVALVAWVLAAPLAAAVGTFLSSRRGLGRALAVTGAAGVLLTFAWRAPGPGPRPAEPPPAPVVEAPARRVLVVGFDGLDPGILDRLMARGDLPTFRRLADEGFLARSRTLPQTLSPVIWTTIATGKAPEEHGILGFLAYRLPAMDCALQRFATADGCGTGLSTWALDGARRLGLATRWPVTSNLRRMRTLWDILSERGLRVNVVNWWASWPAERVRGALVSDRFHHAATTSARLAPDSRLTFPAPLVEELAPLLVRPGDMTPDDLRPFFAPDSRAAGGQAEEVRTHESLNDWSQGRDAMLRAFLSSDRTYLAVASHLLEKGDWDFAAVYFRGIDVASHLTGAFSALHGKPATGRVAARYAGTLEAYYRLADSQLAQLLARVDDDTDVLVCSDHGFGWEPEHGFNHVETAPDGVFLLHGPDAARGRGAADVRDITPTLLRLLNQPVPQDVEGQVLEIAFAPDSPARRATSSVASYEVERRRLGRSAESQDDAQIHEELRALGYVN